MVHELNAAEIEIVSGGALPYATPEDINLLAYWLATGWSDNSTKIGSLYGKLLGQTQADVEKAMLRFVGETAY
ncbi:MAG: hypothetical protein MUF47_14305 [Porphyrobacter sp.]|nr:hypothetical protein [Porphyrobacter sp.]